MLRIILGTIALLSVSGSSAPVPEPAAFVRARDRMVAEVKNLAATAAMGADRQLNETVLDALRTVPRHLFVPPSLRKWAYDNRPLEIGHDQTISQPFIVALMTNMLRPAKDHVVLEVGTGSGYQAAILATLVRHVYSIEIVAPLAREASERLRDLGYGNITVRQGDGYAGWPEHAPFDAIIVTAGAPRIPPALVDQMKPGGRMAIPIGPVWADQKLILVEKRPDGKIETRSLGSVRFVPLTGAGSEH
jgi:protein-L-isoaspartate(D-aspartate) O-methyltransferase